MGILRFFLHVKNNFPECLQLVKDKQTLQELGVNIDSYMLDENAIIHPVCQKLFAYGSDSLMYKSTKKVTEKDIFYGVCNKNEELRRIVNPKQEFMIAIDGVAGVSKQTQQRSRRFKSAKERPPTQTFDSNCITTGTEFMGRLSYFIHNNIEHQYQNNPEYKDLRVVFSNEKVVGEGEHEIIHYIKDSLDDFVYCVHSPDADLIMLTLPIFDKKIYILRENIYKQVDAKYFLVDVSKYRQQLIEKLKFQGCDEELVIYDFILMCFLLGNDFLPHSPSLEIGNEGLEVIMKLYPLLGKHLVYENKNKLCINTKNIQEFFSLLSNEEGLRLIKKKELLDKCFNSFPDTLLNKYVKKEIKKNDYGEELGETTIIDYEGYRKDYYGDDDPEKVCYEYLRGLLFNLRYYINKIPDWHWCYPYKKTPLFSDLAVYLKKGVFNGEMEFVNNEPLNPYEQLLCVLPPSSKNLLPTALRPLLEEGSPIIDFYPNDFEIDLDGKFKDYEGVPILPIVDVERLRNAYKTVEKNLTEDEKKRSKQGKRTIYKMEGRMVKKRYF